MQYMGGKSRIAKALSEVIEATDGEYWEPFVGGFGSFEVIAPKFKVAHANDIHPDLMLMWDAVLNHGWEPPTEVSLEQYKELRHAEPSALRGFVGFGCSFGGRWFEGYARKVAGDDSTGLADMSARAVNRAKNRLTGTTVHTHNTQYNQLNPKPGDVVYCDPPYQNTKFYSKVDALDYQEFWRWAQSLSEWGVNVYVSSYQAPDGWVSIWSKELSVTVKGGQGDFKNTEHLFVWGNVTAES